VTALSSRCRRYFNDAQRQATKKPVEIAGLNVIESSTSHRGCAGVRTRQEDQFEKILVFDLGGGTFDVFHPRGRGGVFEVKSTNGDTHLGGDDYDRRVVDWVADEFKEGPGHRPAQ